MANIWSYDTVRAVPSSNALDLTTRLDPQAEDNADNNSRSRNTRFWVRRLPTLAAATLIGLAATPDLTFAKEGEVYVGISDGAQEFATPQRWNNYFCVSGERCAVGDVNGDGSADVIAFQHRKAAESGVYVSLSEWRIDVRTGKLRFQFGAPQKWNKSFPSFCTEDDNGLSGDLSLTYP
jgi:hypothetical protein